MVTSRSDPHEHARGDDALDGAESADAGAGTHVGAGTTEEEDAAAEGDDAVVDEWGAESFPASDPPNSWAGPPPP